MAINARNLLTFGLTYFVNDWVANEGPLNVFNVLGSTFSKPTILSIAGNMNCRGQKPTANNTSVAVVLLTIPLWVFGKKIRSAIARNDTLTRFMKDD